jgi:hypothetical protein
MILHLGVVVSTTGYLLLQFYSAATVSYTFYLFLFSSRLYQMAKLYLYAPSSGLYGCPLAMTDGAAKSIEVGRSI